MCHRFLVYHASCAAKCPIHLLVELRRGHYAPIPERGAALINHVDQLSIIRSFNFNLLIPRFHRHYHLDEVFDAVGGLNLLPSVEVMQYELLAIVIECALQCMEHLSRLLYSRWEKFKVIAHRFGMVLRWRIGQRENVQMLQRGDLKDRIVEGVMCWVVCY